MNPIVYAIPVFFVLMALELAVAHRRQKRVYRVGDTISSVGLGAVSQVTGLYSRVISLGVYVLAFETLAVTTLPADAWWVWLIGLVLYDFLYYWHHRYGHEVALFWAAHVVHHQSEDFNLGTALRQSSSGFLVGWIFYLPMALLGFPPLVFVVVALIDLLYQYWIHTEQIGRLGWFDRVFASPSNHRVHHGVNDRYLDKNYGGILIVWDRLFGTFEDERDDEPVVYGTRKPLGSHDPIWANLEVYAALVRMSWRTQRWSDKLRVWFKPPGWRPADLAAREPAAEFDIRAVRKYDPPLSTLAAIFAGVVFVLLVAAGTQVLAVDGADLTRAGVTVPGALFAAWVVLSLWALGRWTEQRRGSAWLLATLLVAPSVPLGSGSALLASASSLLAIGALVIAVRPVANAGSTAHASAANSVPPL